MIGHGRISRGLSMSLPRASERRHATTSAVVYLTIGVLLAQRSSTWPGPRTLYISGAIILVAAVGLSRDLSRGTLPNRRPRWLVPRGCLGADLSCRGARPATARHTPRRSAARPADRGGLSRADRGSRTLRDKDVVECSLIAGYSGSIRGRCRSERGASSGRRPPPLRCWPSMSSCSCAPLHQAAGLQRDFDSSAGASLDLWSSLCAAYGGSDRRTAAGGRVPCSGPWQA